MTVRIYDKTGKRTSLTVNLSLVKSIETNGVDLVIVDANGEPELIIATIDDLGLHLWQDLYASSVPFPLDSNHRIKVLKDF